MARGYGASTGQLNDELLMIRERRPEVIVDIDFNDEVIIRPDPMTEQDIVDLVDGLPPQKIHCSVLADDALRKAIEDYRKGPGPKK